MKRWYCWRLGAAQHQDFINELPQDIDTVVVERGIRLSDGHGAKSILIVAHRLSTVEHCDRLFRLAREKLVKKGAAGRLLGKMTWAK